MSTNFNADDDSFESPDAPSDEDTFSDLHVLAGDGKIETIIAHWHLLSRDLELRWRSYTPIRQAVRYGHVVTACALADRGANVQTCDDHGESLLHLAARMNDAVMAKELIRLGVSLEIADHDGCLPIHYGADFGDGALLAHVAGDRLWERADSLGNRAIHRAAAADNIPALEWFLQQGIPVDALDADGNTPLHCAIAAHAGKSIERLSAAGADWNAKAMSGLTASEFLRLVTQWREEAARKRT